MATRNGSATWNGNLQDGSGRLSVGDGVFEGDYSFSSRFEEGEGTNPEELIAAAHAACFSMALSNIMAGEGHEPKSVSTTAKVHLRNVDGAPTIATIELETEGDVPGLDEDGFRDFAEKAKADCPVSRALGGVGEIEVNARLAG
jgi:osmotically inducible protein OsmC